jgi:hypothetical protein
MRFLRVSCVFFLFLLLVGVGPTFACFGTQLKVGVFGESDLKKAAFALGYFIEEKTGVVPEFIEIKEPVAALEAGRIDIIIVPSAIIIPRVYPTRIGGSLPKLGELRFVLATNILDDLRFTTVERALSLLPDFYKSKPYRNSKSGTKEKQAARKAVSDGG